VCVRNWNKLTVLYYNTVGGPGKEKMLAIAHCVRQGFGILCVGDEGAVVSLCAMCWASGDVSTVCV
jgi:hypothetical protein